MSLLCHAMPFDSPFSLPSEYFALTRSEVFSLILSSRLSALTANATSLAATGGCAKGSGAFTTSVHSGLTRPLYWPLILVRPA